MNKKLAIEITIILTAILLLLIFFYYPVEKKDLELTNKTTEIENEMSTSNKNIIKNMKYFSENKNGDSFVIFSDYGKIDFDNPDLTHMTNVTAIVSLKKPETITITSNFANFNHISYETEFFENVVIVRDDEKITSEKLEFFIEDNLIVISKDVILYKPHFNLKADKVEIDLITKNSTIMMENKKQVIVMGENK
mgnify:CR=1 FL=1